MQEAWLNFSIVVFAQLLFFVVCAYYEEKFSEIPRMLGQGILVGLALGLVYDYAINFFGLNSYTLGFGMPFLVINAALSYGIFVANILTLQNVRLPKFILWNIALVAVYEATNHFFDVWDWKFELPPIEFFIVLLVGYTVGALIVVAISHVFLGRRFLFVNNLFKNTNK